MPVFIAAFGGMLINIVGTLAGRVLVALGIGVVTYTGVNYALDSLKTQAVNSFQSLPPDMMAVIQLMRVGQCISIIFSAIAVRLLLDGVNGGTFKKWVSK